MKKLGAAVGLDDKATKVLVDFDSKVAKTRSSIKLPTQEIAPIRNNDTEIVVFTDKSAQGLLLASLGFKLRTVPDHVKKGIGNEGAGSTSSPSPRRTSARPSATPAAFVGHKPDQITAAQTKPLWSSLPAVTGQRVYDLGLDSFRLDYFSASAILDRVGKTFVDAPLPLPSTAEVPVPREPPRPHSVRAMAPSLGTRCSRNPGWRSARTQALPAAGAAFAPQEPGQVSAPQAAGDDADRELARPGQGAGYQVSGDEQDGAHRA